MSENVESLGAERISGRAELEGSQEASRSRLRKLSYLVALGWSIDALRGFVGAPGVWDQVSGVGSLVMALGWPGFMVPTPRTTVPCAFLIMVGGVMVGVSAKHDVQAGILGGLGFRGVGAFLIAVGAGYAIVRHLVAARGDAIQRPT